MSAFGTKSWRVSSKATMSALGQKQTFCDAGAMSVSMPSRFGSRSLSLPHTRTTKKVEKKVASTLH